MDMLPKRVFSTFAIWILVISTVLGIYRPVQAGSALTVTINSDEFEADAAKGQGCSLREAIRATNMNTAFGGCQASSTTDTIIVPAGNYSLTRTDAYEDDAINGDLDIRESITISGAGASTTIISAGGLGDRVFHILAGAGRPVVKFSDLQVTGGRSTLGGGGILVRGASLQLDRVLVTGNGNPNYVGGGISSTNGSVLVVTGSTISGNTSSYGGGIHSDGAVTIVDSSITGNSAKIAGGGLSSLLADANVGFAQITRSSITLNYVDNLLQGAGISSNGRLTIQDSIVQDNEGIGVQINSGSIAIINNSQFRGNTSTNPDYGAGIDSNDKLTINNSLISGNSGPGMVVKSSDLVTVTIWKTNIEKNLGLGLRVNSGSKVMAASSNFVENTPSDPTGGAGIASAGALTLNNSAIVKNGGVGLLVSGGAAALTNTTIGANARLDPGDPTYGIWVTNGGSLALLNSTIADHAGAGLRLDGAAAASAGSTIFARNGLANCTLAASGAFTSQGNNLLATADAPGTGPCAFVGGGDQVGDPFLDDQPRDNGGHTYTYALLDMTSPAVDAIGDSDPACLVVDQRGYGRPVDGNANGSKDCDTGAFELGATGIDVYLAVIQR